MKNTSIFGICVMAGFLTSAPAQSNEGALTITTTKGRTYERCRILKSDPDGLCFAHAGGAAKVPFSHLGKEWQDRFHYDAGKAKAFVTEHITAQRDAARARAHRHAERRRHAEGARFYASVRHRQRHGLGPWGGRVFDGGYGFGPHGLPDHMVGDPFGFGGGVGSGIDGDFGGGFDFGGHTGHGSKGHLHHFGNYRAFPVQPFLTFGGNFFPGYPGYPTYGTAGGYFGSFHRPSVFRPNVNVLPSGGMRVGGTGGLIRAGSSGISHK